MSDSLTSSQTILNDLLEHERSETAQSLSASKFFELFSAEQILKNFGLSYEELENGIVDDKGGDGGIDSFYTFVNGILVTEESTFENIRESLVIRVVIIQSKTSYGFGEDAILKIKETFIDLLDISNVDVSKYKSTYNQKLIRATEIFRNAYRTIMAQMPELQFSIFYATKGDQVHPNIRAKTATLEKAIKNIYTHSQFNFSFIGAEELLTLARKSKTENLTLQIDQALSVQTGGAICLVPLKSYFKFIQDDETGDLRGWLFEENVRDYEGKNIEVNKAIRESLSQGNGNKEFWWLNNGITIVAATSNISSNILTMTSPKVVNGLQTSTEIYNYYHSNDKQEKETF